MTELELEEDESAETAEDAEEWQAEAGKWKQKASEAEKAAAENSAAASRVAELEGTLSEREKRHTEKLAEAERLAEEAEKAARAEGERTAAEWQAEAEKWKQATRKYEDLAKKNLAAATRLEKLEAEAATAKTTKAEVDAKAAETKADLEAKATQAELKAMRLSVAQELDVPGDLIDLLSGSSKREIEASADKLLRELAANKQPEPEKLKAAKAAVEEAAKAKEDGELAQARKLLAEAETKALRLEVATEKQLPPGLAELLTGRTREQLDRQADALITAIGGVRSEKSTRARMPTERLRSGALPEGAGDSDIDPGKLADSILRRNRGY